MKNSSIEWTHHTFNPWQGCTKVSAGCAHCYAETLSNRWGKDLWGPGKERQRTSAAYWRQPIAWDKEAEKAGERRRVFCASMADVFDEAAPLMWKGDLMLLIEKTPSLDWLLLTKRPENARGMFRDFWFPYVFHNVWLGVSCEDHPSYVSRNNSLSQISAKVRFLSCEPLLGKITLGARLPDWVIVGGESGPKARPMEVEWARYLRDQCSAAGIPFFLKQMGGVRDKRGNLEDFPEDLRIRQFPSTVQV
jgi:protein gp37